MHGGLKSGDWGLGLGDHRTPKRRTPNVERRTPNAERRTPNAERTLNPER
jgi:hypothetical protein